MSKPKTASQASFAQTVHANIRRSTFLRPSSLKTTFNCGKLVPIYCDEVIPGDSRRFDLKMLSRLSTPLFPTMDDLTLEFYAFFVPNRLVWSGWESLCGENKTSAWVNSPAPALVPVFTSGTQAAKKIGDYYGIPTGAVFDETHNPVSCLPFRGYGLIRNEWFRDENLQAPIVINTGNTADAANATYGPNGDLLSVNKFHDYFTSALPAPQKGASPLIPIELNTLIPVITGAEHGLTPLAGVSWAPMMYRFVNGTDAPTGAIQSAMTANFDKTDTVSGVTRYTHGDSMTDLSKYSEYANTKPVTVSNLWADARNMGPINATTISQLRTLFQVQKLYEKDARAGTRYVESLKAHYGVDAGDYRLQRPEFLGHFKTRVGMQSVPQTSSTDSTSPQGNLAAYSLTVGGSTVINKFFVEHGFIHIFAVARQVKTYQQGIERFWSRRDRFDFYYPTLAHISEQPIYNREIFALNSGADIGVNSQVFGYQEAWADYRYKPNRVSGQMRSGSVDSDNNPNSLDVWHYADYYESQPVLSDGWITDNSATNVNRTLAVKMSKDDQIRMDCEFLDIATRPMPVYSIPGLVDHF